MLLGCAEEVSAGAVVPTISLSTRADYGNGAALEGSPHSEWRNIRTSRLRGPRREEGKAHRKQAQY
jgi:hypothetical protein